MTNKTSSPRLPEGARTATSVPPPWMHALRRPMAPTTTTPQWSCSPRGRAGSSSRRRLNCRMLHLHRYFNLLIIIFLILNAFYCKIVLNVVAGTAEDAHLTAHGSNAAMKQCARRFKQSQYPELGKQLAIKVDIRKAEYFSQSKIHPGSLH